MNKREVFENLLDKSAMEYSICDIEKTKGFAYSFSLQLEEKDKEIERLNKENKQLKENWNKLKETLSGQINDIQLCNNENIRLQMEELRYVLTLMQELEKSDSNE